MVRLRGKKIHLLDDTSYRQKIVVFFAEVFATAILMFLGCLGCVPKMAGDPVLNFSAAFGFGMGVLVALQCFAHISGAHINPLVSTAAVLLGNLALVQLPIYIIGQILGSILGMALIKLITPREYMGGFYEETGNGTTERVWGVCSPKINPEIEIWQGFAVEFLASFILILTCGGVWDTLDKADSIPVRFGFTVGVLALSLGPYTGCHMNPARSIGPSIINNDWDYHWVFWLGPYLGCVCASMLYRFLFSTSQDRDKEEVSNNFN